MSIPSDQPRDEAPTAPIGPIDGPSRQDMTTTTTMVESPTETSDTIPISVDIPDQSMTEESAPAADPPATRRGRGRPAGSKNKPKVCPNCTPSTACVTHCMSCKAGLACDLHTASQRCAKCTRTRLCAEHTLK